MSPESQEVLSAMLADVVGEVASRLRAELQAECERLGGDIGTLRNALDVLERGLGGSGGAFRGVWRRQDDEYPAGSIVVCDGSVWGMTTATREKPDGRGGAWRRLRTEQR